MTTVEDARSAEFAIKREHWTRQYLNPASERPSSSARGIQIEMIREPLGVMDGRVLG